MADGNDELKLQQSRTTTPQRRTFVVQLPLQQPPTSQGDAASKMEDEVVEVSEDEDEKAEEDEAKFKLVKAKNAERKRRRELAKLKGNRRATAVAPKTVIGKISAK